MEARHQKTIRILRKSHTQMPFPGDILTSVLRQKHVNAVRLLDQLVAVMKRKAHFPRDV